MKLSKKTKTILTPLVSILVATSVVAPLSTITSCSNKTNELESQFDKEYGVTEETYNDLKDQFINQYETRLELEGIAKETEEFNARVGYLKKQLSSLDKMKEQRKNGFTSLTSAMMEFAKSKDSHDLDKKPYDIKLTRKTKATWSQMDALFNSWKGSFRQYMLNSDMPAATITRVMQDAQNKFVSLKKELQQTCNDALDGIIQAKSRIISCFEGVNDDIALVSSTIQLKEFLSQYVFEPKEHDDDACLDTLLKDTKEGNCDFKVGNVLSDTTINRIFNIYRKDEGHENPINFTSTIIKGYTIFPKLTKIASNKFENVHTFSLDFGLVKTSYIGKYSKDQLSTVTAHTYVSDDFNSDDINDKTSLSDLIRKMSIKSIDYPINLTLKSEKEALIETYFNKDAEYGHISFNWDNKNNNNQAYEAFFDNAVQQTDGTWKASLTSESLKNSLIRISNNESSYKFVNSISSSIVKRKDKDVKFQNLSEQFLDSCDFSTDVTINENDTTNKVVKIDSFYANYSNSSYKRDDGGKLNLRDVDYSSYQDQCVNHHVSKAFYEKVNNKFNGAIRYVTLYDATAINTILGNNGKTKEETLEKVLQTAEEQKFSATTALVAASIATTSAVLEAWSPASDVNTKKIIIVSLIFLFVCLGLQAATFALFMTEYYNKLLDHVEKEREVRDQIKSLPIVNSLITDSSNYVLFEDDGSYDEKQFNERMEKFNQHDMPWMLKQYRRYSNVETGEWIPFQTCIKDVNDEVYEDKFEDWKLGGKWWLTSLGLTLFTLIASIFLGKWIKRQRQEYKQRLAEIKYSRLESETPIKQQMDDLQKTLEASFKEEVLGLPINANGPISLSDAKYFCKAVWFKITEKFHHNLYAEDYDKRDKDLDNVKADKLKDFFNREYASPDTKFDWDIQTFLDLTKMSIG